MFKAVVTGEYMLERIFTERECFMTLCMIQYVKTWVLYRENAEDTNQLEAARQGKVYIQSCVGADAVKECDSALYIPDTLMNM
jgi:hypothetical protein